MLSLGRRKAMPQFDGTGPSGKGPMTGRGLGYCVIPLSTSEEELNYLKKRGKVLKQELVQIRGRTRQIKESLCVTEKE
jgi:Family of unknown function (DUF5320)